MNRPLPSLRSAHQPAFDHLSRQIQSDLAASGVCPLCGGPMTPRYGRTGPYFHCRCYEETGDELRPPRFPDARAKGAA